jgi:hypothetical protein
MSNSLRDRLIRFRPWTRPGVWAGFSLCSALGLVGWLVAQQLSQNPNWVEGLGEMPRDRVTSSAADRENQAIGADIDNLSLLFNDLDRSPQLPTALPDSPAGRATQKAAQLNANDDPKTDSAPSDARFGLLSLFSNLPIAAANSNAFNTSSRLNLPSATTIASATPTEPTNAIARQTSSSPLADAIARLNVSPVNTTPSGTSNNSLNRLSNDPNNLTGNTTATANPTAIGLAQTGFGQNAPIPIAGSTGLPSTTVNSTFPLQGSTGLNPGNGGFPTMNSYTGIFSPAGNGATIAPGDVPAAPATLPLNSNLGSPLGPSGSNLPSSAIAPIPLNPTSQEPLRVPENQAPFSAPRPIPGRNIGGGDINTFSNP